VIGVEQDTTITAGTRQEATIEEVAERLAGVLLGGDLQISDTEGRELVFEDRIGPLPFEPAPAPVEVWAVDGGQALVADARCLQVYVTRAARVCFRDGLSAVEDDTALRAHLLGGDTRALARQLGLEDSAAVDVNVLRDWAEWAALAVCVDEAAPGAVLLVDGDLIPDWRLAPSLAADVIARAAERSCIVAAVTKHSSLARGGAPLVGQLELEAERVLGPRTRWWAPVARTRAGSAWPDIQVVIARLDPDARYAFRIDLPGGVDAPAVLGALAGVADDAAFPGYPYPLSVADRLAACPSWLRQEAWLALDACLDEAGVPPEVRERAFADRHRLMERS
jgi:hypothetical protein